MSIGTLFDIGFDREDMPTVSFEPISERIRLPFEGDGLIASAAEKPCDVEPGKAPKAQRAILGYMNQFMEERVPVQSARVHDQIDKSNRPDGRHLGQLFQPRRANQRIEPWIWHDATCHTDSLQKIVAEESSQLVFLIVAERF